MSYDINTYSFTTAKLFNFKTKSKPKKSKIMQTIRQFTDSNTKNTKDMPKPFRKEMTLHQKEAV